MADQIEILTVTPLRSCARPKGVTVGDGHSARLKRSQLARGVSVERATV